ncbi:hypothetical protein [Burkholderia multivorans]|uniref:hypothetical protein n=1 Tax=Burkholderia multivorans TaxID=87883 RepID=UPI00207C6B4C|nr:hypothetical protein [Burkholderia multivorans]MCO1402519.1 hypothetical protein [Burkholderia multivorans]
MKFDILHNTVRTAHFDALQSMFRAAETASAASRRATKHLVHRTLPSSPLPPFIPREALINNVFVSIGLSN